MSRKLHLDIETFGQPATVVALPFCQRLAETAARGRHEVTVELPDDATAVRVISAQKGIQFTVHRVEIEGTVPFLPNTSSGSVQ